MRIQARGGMNDETVYMTRDGLKNHWCSVYVIGIGPVQHAIERISKIRKVDQADEPPHLPEFWLNTRDPVFRSIEGDVQPGECVDERIEYIAALNANRCTTRRTGSTEPPMGCSDG